MSYFWFSSKTDVLWVSNFIRLFSIHVYTKACHKRSKCLHFLFVISEKTKNHNVNKKPVQCRWLPLPQVSLRYWRNSSKCHKSTKFGGDAAHNIFFHLEMRATKDCWFLKCYFPCFVSISWFWSFFFLVFFKNWCVMSFNDHKTIPHRC